jgi:hypothetical protein
VNSAKEDPVNELFDQLTELQAGKRLPPVHSWHPDRSGSIDIRIASDGTWFHEGDPILRIELVRLFSTVLRKDPEGFCLVTPAEKLLITVDDAPFIAVDLEVKGTGTEQQLLFVTNVDESVLAGADHQISVTGPAESPRPYLHVRDGLDALIGRPVYYRMVELCESAEDGYWLVSCGERFQLG